MHMDLLVIEYKALCLRGRIDFLLNCYFLLIEYFISKPKQQNARKEKTKNPTKQKPEYEVELIIFE